MLAAILYLVVYKTTYYILEDKKFTFVCMGKETVVEYSKVHYIDAKKGKDTKTIGLYFSPTTVKYFMNDKDGKLYDELMDKCTQLFDESYTKTR